MLTPKQRAMPGRLSARVRLGFTGYVVNRSRVYDDTRVVASCDHQHKNASTARRCANLMLRRLEREATAPGATKKKASRGG